MQITANLDNLQMFGVRLQQFRTIFGYPQVIYSNFGHNTGVRRQFLQFTTISQSSIENGIFWDQIWLNLGLNDGHAQARMGEHVTKLISIHSLYTKNISSKFHRNLMNQNRNMLENIHFGPDQPNCPAHFCPFCPKKG